MLDALQDRFATRPAAGHVTVAGEEITGATPLEKNEGVLSKLLGFETVSTEALVQDSSFTFTPAAEAAAPQPAFWGAGALSSFAGRQDALSLDGRVITALLGADWSTERWRAGVALSHSRGSGAHEAEEGANHDVSSSMTGLFPYGRYELTPRLGFWAVAGYGWGRFLLKPHGNAAEAVEAPSNLRMGAVGMDGLLLDGGDESITLSTTADLLLVGATSAAVDGLAASEGSLSRLRLGR
ncbi:MAG: autotransporter domain-containing protein [Cyanobacteria bacterium MAG CAR4_bin_6]|nr:autotransporter domain-containing protein [Cyanobacteria bacterium MAG CAR4_bin_6]